MLDDQITNPINELEHQAHQIANPQLSVLKASSIERINKLYPLIQQPKYTDLHIHTIIENLGRWIRQYSLQFCYLCGINNQLIESTDIWIRIKV